MTISTLLNWPSPFPTYVGRFAYLVDEKNHPEPVAKNGQKFLGNGTFVWQLEILGETVHLSSFGDGHRISFHMKKQLQDLPADASSALRAQRGNYIIEEWVGDADLDARSFFISCSGTSPAPIECTLSLAQGEIPLSRPILAGSYQMVLERGDSIIKSVHSSWVEFANLKPHMAMGYLLRVEKHLCPMLYTPYTPEATAKTKVEKRLDEANDFLLKAEVYDEGERVVKYRVISIHVMSVSTTEQEWEGTVDLELTYQAARADIFEHVIDPAGWEPHWKPELLEIENTRELDSMKCSAQRPSIRIIEGKVCVTIGYCYRGCFLEPLELRNFPFDVQWFHVKFEGQQQVPVRLEPLDGSMEQVDCHLFCQDWIKEKVDVRHPDSEDDSKMRTKFTTRVNIGIRARRNPFTYVTRVLAVMCLTILVSFSTFSLDPLEDLGDRLSLIFTMMLTAAAYSAVVASLLPTVGYNTILDDYVLAVFMSYGIVVAQVSTVGMLAKSQAETASTDDPGFMDKFLGYLSQWGAADLDRKFIQFDFCVMLFAHIFLVFWIFGIVLPAERAKQIDGFDDEPFIIGDEIVKNQKSPKRRSRTPMTEERVSSRTLSRSMLSETNMHYRALPAEIS